jgi:prepilin signal peptidase PulO-like enzyme (type II secretory pathway)
MDLLNYFFFFLFGSAIGSFLGVVVERLPRGKDFFRGRSHCDNCKKSLGVLDLVPVFSFIFLKGRCRYCHKRLSYFYPIIEFVTGILFVLVSLHTGILYHVFSILYVLEIIYYLFIVSTLVVLFFIDLKYGILPFSIIFPAVLISFIYKILNTKHLIQNDLLSAVGAFAFFLFLFGITRGRGMGFGDVVYVFFMGLLLGFPKIILGLYIAFISGAVISIILIGVKKKKLKGSTVPFGPFLVAGTLIAMFWGDKLIGLIFNFLLK